MAKNITTVAWAASGVPTGINFDNSLGIFSGTPTETGDYTVPVQVTTNYGTDAKDVIIHVVSGGEPAPVTYIVSFESNGGSTVASKTVNEGETVTCPANPTRDGFGFLGWFVDSAGTTEFDFSTPITTNITIYAMWEVAKWTVTFISNGGPEVEPQIVNDGETATRPSSFSRTGYSFHGWYTENEFVNKFDFTTPITSNITLYAFFEIKTFKVNFHAHGGSAVDSQTVNYGETVTRPNNPTKDGFGFLGWFVDSAGTTEFDFTTPITANITLHAIWEAGVCTVTFISNGGTSVPTQTVNAGEKATEPDNPIRTGYKFKGWYSDSELTDKFSFNTKLTSDITLYANWEILTYTVKFESNGGSEVESQKVDYNEKATQPSNPTKTDYNFAGWYSDSELTSQFNFNTAITANITLYAKWTMKTYTVTFNSNGGTFVSPKIVNHGETVTQPSNPTKTGNTFAGWYNDSALTSQFNFSTAITSDITLYAKWEVVTSQTYNFVVKATNNVGSMEKEFSITVVN